MNHLDEKMLKSQLAWDEDKEFICPNCLETYADGDTFCCEFCGTLICPKCGKVISTIKDYDEAMKANQE